MENQIHKCEYGQTYFQISRAGFNALPGFSLINHSISNPLPKRQSLQTIIESRKRVFIKTYTRGR